MSVSATTTTTTVVVVALLLVIDIPFMVSTPPSQFFLTDRDFANALRLSVNRHRHRSSLLVNDMRIQQRRTRRGSGVTLTIDKWPNGRVPYVLSGEYSVVQRAMIARAIAAYGQRTCIQFVPKGAYDTDYVYVGKIDGCFADFARVGGRQHLSLADECVDYPTIVHELMHVIGFIHEHQREDRDTFVRINWQNIIRGATGDFEKLHSNGRLSSYGEPYDYWSIMHYESTEGSTNGRNTIEAVQVAYTPLLGKGTDFSAIDLMRINRAYNCPHAG